MIQYNSNINQVAGSITEKLKSLQENPDPMLRTVAFAVLPEMKKRVHVEGKDSTGSQIGTYSPGYMQLRTGNYQNSGRKTKGKSKGELKDAGTVSRGDRKGQPRPRYNRTGDTKVVLSLTRQMENDLSVLPSGSGYGIGYNNPDNFKKSQYNEATYEKKIWNLTADEKALAKQTSESYAKQILE
jgi:hypothetical protein